VIIIVKDETGSRYEYDTDKQANCLFPGPDEKEEVAAALTEAIAFLRGPAHLSPV
jgi:hypothetical protein